MGWRDGLFGFGVIAALLLATAGVIEVSGVIEPRDRCEAAIASAAEFERRAMEHPAGAAHIREYRAPHDLETRLATIEAEEGAARARACEREIEAVREEIRREHR